MNKSKQITLGVTLLATAAALYIRWRNRQDDATPSLLDLNVDELYYKQYDMNTNELLPRGYRNNNPVNIRISGNNWRGKVSPNTDGAFEQFIDLVHGYRAALVLLRGRGYISGGNNTIRKIITKFAPANENNTAGYINRVSQMSGIDPDTVISKNDRDSLVRILYAMSTVENGTKDKAGNNLEATYGLPSMDIINKAWEIM